MDDGISATGVIAQVLVAVLAGLFVYRLLFYRRADFVIVIKDSRVHSSKGIPVALRQNLAVFLLRDLALTGPVKIIGSYVEKGRRLFLWSRGKITKGELQRVRNFLATRV
jgi:hypothetical protein